MKATIGANAGKYMERPKIDAQLITLRYYPAVRFLDWQHINYPSARLITPDEDWQYTNQPYNQWAGVPIEVCVDAAQAAGAVPWLHIPHNVTDAEIAGLSQRLPDHSPVILEISNELWNHAFWQLADAAELAKSRSHNTSVQNKQQAALMWQAQQTIKMRMATGPNVRIVIAGQCRNIEVLRFLLSIDGVADAVDALAIAPYFNDQVEIQERLKHVRAHRRLANAHKKELWAYELGQDRQGEGAASINRSQYMRDLYAEGLDVFSPLFERIMLYNAASVYKDDDHGMAWGLIDWSAKRLIKTAKFHAVIQTSD